MSVCDLPGISDICQGTTSTADSLAELPFDWLANALGNTAQQAVKLVWTAMTQTTLVDVQAPGYLSIYNLAFGIAVIVMLGLFLAQLIGGMVHREPGALSRAGIGLTKAVFGSFLAVSMIALALQATDELSEAIVQAAGTTMDALGSRLAAAMVALVPTAAASPAAGVLIVIFLGGLAVSGAGILWLSLLVRKALILVATVLAPFALAGWAWDSSRSWPGRWVSVLLALIVSKLVVTVLFLVAITQLDAPIDSDLADLSQPVAGIVILALAAFAPYLCYKLLAFVGIDTYHLTSLEAEGKSALNRPLPVASGVPFLPNVRQWLGGGGGSSSPASGGGGSTGLPGGGSPGLPGAGAGAEGVGGDAAGVAAAETAAPEAATMATTASTAASAVPVAGAAVMAAQAVQQRVDQTRDAGPAAGAALGGIAAAQHEGASSGSGQ